MGTVYANPLARSTILGKEFRGFSLLSQTGKVSFAQINFSGYRVYQDLRW